MTERGGFSMPLSMCKAGETVHVVRVKGAESMKRHLGNLGFVEGAEVRVVNCKVGYEGHGRIGAAARAARGSAFKTEP